jgi:hypothetical protein
MKKYILYIVLGVAVLLAVMFFFRRGRERVMDERITLRAKDKIPYGMYVAYNLLPSLFPNAVVQSDNNMPGSWDRIDTEKDNQAVVLMSKEFDAENFELNSLYSFANKGNYVLIIASSLSKEASDFFNCSSRNLFFNFDIPDSLSTNLIHPPFSDQKPYVYPGKNYSNRFYKFDTSHSIVLGKTREGNINFIGMRTGKGVIFIHLAPIAFSNYFLLHKNNINYYKNAFAVIPQNVTAIVWNDYFLTKFRKPQEREPNWFRVLMKYPAFKWGLLTALYTLILFALLEARRKQRIIPEIKRPVNDSMDFVKTIGRLYFDKGDHKNLANKMSAYFLEHIRNQYKLPTHTIDNEFVIAVHNKTAYPESELKQIVQFIQFIQDAPAISEKQLSDYHKQLELFYQNT